VLFLNSVPLNVKILINFNTRIAIKFIFVFFYKIFRLLINRIIMDKLKNSRINKVIYYIKLMKKVQYFTIFKGLSYTIAERQKLSIHGLLPPVVTTQAQEVDRVLVNLQRISNDLDKYVYLMHLLDRYN
jgi:hypothetical protein